MPGDWPEPSASTAPAFSMGYDPTQHFRGLEWLAAVVPEHLLVNQCPLQWVGIGSTPHHHTVYFFELLVAGLEILEASIQLNSK